MVHLIKLCVGAKDPQTLKSYQDSKSSPLFHVTRMWPKRSDELKAGGSLYWVMSGEIRARQSIIDFEEVVVQDGIRRCKIIYDRELVLVAPTPRRPFQGWRYLADEQAPPDLGNIDDSDLPDSLAVALSMIGLR